MDIVVVLWKSMFYHKRIVTFRIFILESKILFIYLCSTIVVDGLLTIKGTWKSESWDMTIGICAEEMELERYGIILVVVFVYIVMPIRVRK